MSTQVGRWSPAEIGYADVVTRIEQDERHVEAVGPGADHVRGFIR